MRLALAFLFAGFLLVVNAGLEEHRQQHHEEKRGPLGFVKKKESHVESEHHRETRDIPFGGEPKKIKMEEPVKEALLKEKKEHVFYEKEIEYFLNNPNTKLDRECFKEHIKPGQSIDFVIDLAPSPNQDKIDKMCAESPIGLFLQRIYRTPSRAYFGAVQLFIDAVTAGMKPEQTHSVIYNDGRKFYIRGRDVEQEKIGGDEFLDKQRNLKTLWPVSTKEVVSNLSPIVKNNLGRMTKLALWNRDNGLPVVLNSHRRSKPFYTIVITDGASGAKLHELSDDLSRTTVIDLGNRRFAKNISYDDMKQLKGVYSLVAPQKLFMLIDTCRSMCCLFAQNA